MPWVQWVDDPVSLAGNGKQPKHTNKDKVKGKQQAPTADKHKKHGASNKPKLQYGQWLCLWEQCPWAMAQKPNLAFRKRCGGCCIVKHESMNPPAKCKVSRSAPPSVSMREAEADAKAAAAKARAANATEHATQKVPTQTQKTAGEATPKATSLAEKTSANKGVITVSPSPADVPAPAATSGSPQHIQAAAAPALPENEAAAQGTVHQRKPITLDTHLWEDMPAVKPVVDALLASMAFDLLPVETPLKTAEEWIAELLGGQPACLHSAKRTSVAAQLQGAQSALTSLAGKDPDLEATITARVQALTAELESLDKRLPSQRKCTASILAAKQAFGDKHEAALETCQRAKAAHLERWQGRRMLTQRVREVMDLLDAEMEKEELKYEDAHEARNSQRTEIAAQVNQLLGTRLDQAENAMNDEEIAPAPAATMGQQVLPVQQPSTAVSAAGNISSTDQQLLARLKQQVAAAQEYNAMLAQFHKRVQGLEALPLLVPTDVDAIRPALIHMHFFLRKWIADGANTPFKLGDLPRNGGTVDTTAVFKEALGDKWALFFDEATAVSAATTVPAHAAHLVAQALTKLDGDLAAAVARAESEQGQEMSNAHQAYAVVVQNNKKRVLDQDNDII